MFCLNYKVVLSTFFCYVLSPLQLKTEFLPLLSVCFVSENSLVAAVSFRTLIHTYLSENIFKFFFFFK